MSKFYFEFNIYFKTDYDVVGLQSVLGLKASKYTMLKDSKGPEDKRRARFKVKTNEFEDDSVSELFESFVLKIKDKVKNLKNILNENQGYCKFCIVYTETAENPKVYLSRDVINFFASIDADFEID